MNRLAIAAAAIGFAAATYTVLVLPPHTGRALAACAFLLALLLTPFVLSMLGGRRP